LKLLRHIDNSFYRLTARQAKTLCGGNLPAWNCEREILPPLPVDYFIADWNRQFQKWFPRGMQYRSGWGMFVLRTPCGYHDGKIVKEGWVWAIRIHESII